MNRIRELRKSRGMTQIDLAARAGLTQGTLSQLEGDKMVLNVKYMRAIAAILDCSPADLLADEDHPLRLSKEEQDFILLLRHSNPTLRDLVARLIVPPDYPDASASE